MRRDSCIDPNVPTEGAPFDASEIRTLCNRLSLRRQEACGEITAKPEYLVVRTPESPTFWFGNYILVRGRLDSGSFSVWEDRFIREIGSESGHRLFVVDTPDGNPGATQEFQAAGYVVEITRSMTFRFPGTEWVTREAVMQDLIPEELDDAGMEELLALRLDSFRNDPASEADADETFLRNQSALHRKLLATKIARCFVLRIEGGIVASVLFIISGAEALIEDVRTVPSLRHRGLCRTLLARSIGILAGQGMELFALEPVDAYAEGIYRKLGFVDGDYLCDILKRPGRSQAES